MKKVLTCSALCLTVLLSVAGRANADLIQNGGFETPTAPTNGFLTLLGPGGGSFVWSIPVGTSIDVINTGFWPAFQGQQSIDLAGSTFNGGQISQSFATTPGQTYTLGFAYANNADFAGTATAHVEVDGLGALLSTNVSHSGSTRANMNYLLFNGTFTANSGTTTLTFTDTTVGDAGQQGIALDAVSVNVAPAAVPEPASLTLWAIASTLGLGWLGRRRKSRRPEAL